MSKTIKKFYFSTKFGIFILSALAFLTSYFWGIANIIIGLLSFLIILEIVRTIWEYIILNTHRIKMRYLIGCFASVYR